MTTPEFETIATTAEVEAMAAAVHSFEVLYAALGYDDASAHRAACDEVAGRDTTAFPSVLPHGSEVARMVAESVWPL